MNFKKIFLLTAATLCMSGCFENIESGDKELTVVTEEEWKIAFGSILDNAHYHLTESNTTSTYELDYEVDGSKEKVNSDGYIYYISKENNKYYKYTNDGGIWNKNECENMLISEEVKVGSGYYKDFTYDSDLKSYKCESFSSVMGGREVDLSNILIKFNEGKLIQVDYTITFEKRATFTHHVTIDEYRNMHVEIPEDIAFTITKAEYNNNRSLILNEGFTCSSYVSTQRNSYSIHVNHVKQDFIYWLDNSARTDENVAIKDGVEFNPTSGKIINIYGDIRNAPQFVDFSTLLPEYESLSYDADKRLYNALVNEKTLKFKFNRGVLIELKVLVNDSVTIYNFNKIGEPENGLKYTNYTINNFEDFVEFYQKTSLYVKERVFYPGQDFSYLTFKSMMDATEDKSFSYPQRDQITDRYSEYWVKYNHDNYIGEEKFDTGKIVYHIPHEGTSSYHDVVTRNHQPLYTEKGTTEGYLTSNCASLYQEGFDEIYPKLNSLNTYNFIDEFVGVASGVSFEGHLTVKEEAITTTNIKEIYFTTKLVDNNYILECDQYFADGKKETWICVNTREANIDINL